MKSLLPLVSLLLSLAFVQHAVAAKVGDRAPGIGIERWLKGQPVKVGPGTSIYVVEFWATWCGPCKTTIPKLTEWQKKFADRGVVFIGISDEPAQVVAPFIASMGDRMDYTVAVDSTKRTFRAWMTAFGEGGIPHAFIVGTNGMVWWHDYPSSELDGMLTRMLEGRIDFETAVNFDQGKKLLEQFDGLAKRQPARISSPLGEKILANHAKDWRIPYRLAYKILKAEGLKERDRDLALRASAKAVEVSKQSSSDAFDIHALALFVNGQKAEAIAAQKKSLEFKKDPKERVEMEKQLAYFENTTPPAPPAKKPATP